MRKYPHILFPVTSDCNLNCPQCCSKGLPDVDIARGLSTLGEHVGESDWVYITGGEPFLVDTLPQICDDIRRLGFRVGITTNGTIFRPNVIGHADRIGVSLDGDQPYHDAYRGAGVFEKAVRLCDAVKKTDCDLVIMSVYFSSNEQALYRLAGVLKELQPDYWQIQTDVFQQGLRIPEELKL